MEFPDDSHLSSNPAIREGIRLLELHPDIDGVNPEVGISDKGSFRAIASIRVRLPSDWIAKGVSPNGVRQLETVTFSFPPDYPIHAPEVELRRDFNRALPHIMPGLSTEPIVPCLYEGSMDELFHAEGLWAIVQQLVDWLEKAARDELIDTSKGWEAIRRDNLESTVVADSNYLRGLVSRKEGFYFFNLSYLKIPSAQSSNASQAYSLHGQLTESVQVTKYTFSKLFNEIAYRPSVKFGHSIAVIVTPGKHSSGKLVIAHQYKPEDVSNLSELRQRAAEYGCDNSLKKAIDWLKKRAKEYNSQTAHFPVIIVLCARRPVNLIGQSSNIELIPYFLEIAAPCLLQAGNLTRVFAVSQLEAISPTLLKKFSGENFLSESNQVSLIGCGSLGSKIAIHMARSGAAPTSVIDKGFLSPHNAARHALLPKPESIQFSWVDAKAQMLACAIEGLGQATTAYKEDITLLTHSPKRIQQLFPSKNWAVINTTASLTVREAIAAIPVEKLNSRIIETCLFGNGAVGILSIEGSQRNPNCLDLMAEIYEIIRTKEDFRVKVFDENNSIHPYTIGQGCSSVTMVIPDSQISLWAASMAQGINSLRSQGLPEKNGRILLGKLGENGMELSWIPIDIPPVYIIQVDNSPWTIRLSERAHQKIKKECSIHSEVETGGILLGRISSTMCAFLVTDVLAAPKDSERSPYNFTLGVEDIHFQLKLYSESCNSALFTLGTWHSHLSDTGPSMKDQKTAAVIASARPAPSVLLIKTPLRYRAILANSN